MKSTTAHSEPTIQIPQPNTQKLPPDLPPPSPEARRAKSLRPLFDKLAEASTELDDMLQSLELSKEETEELLASQKFHSHRQLRTTLLTQQLQLVAQSHARTALEHLARLTESHHPAIARLAATQILSYAGLSPTPPQSSAATAAVVQPPPSPHQPQSKMRGGENQKSKIPSLLQTALLALTLLTLYFKHPAPPANQLALTPVNYQLPFTNYNSPHPLYPSPFILYPSPMPSNPALSSFIDQTVNLTSPDNIHLCTGSPEEYSHLTHEMVETGTLIKLNPEKRPNSFYCRSDPADVARVEQFTFICSQNKSDAGPTNNWADPTEMKAKLAALFTNSMRGRTLYVIPYSMGPIGSPISNIGVELTDSPYVAASMHIMTRIGTPVLEALGSSPHFVRATHSLGAPLDDTSADVPWPHNKDHKYICHFPESREILSFGSGYGGNALLGKKCHALRIASVQARDEGWLAEHMLILKLTAPQGQGGGSKFIAGAFPSACGKTNLAMLDPTLVGWKVHTIGDDIAWMKFGADGKLYAINPEAGFFGVAPGTSYASNPNAMKTITKNTLFTNCTLTEDDDAWWEGMTSPPPANLIDWTRRPWTAKSRRKAAHPNARFTVPAKQCPVIAPEWEDPSGVPISAILFGGRRASTIPLVQEALSWTHGVFLGSIMASETTAAAAGKTGALRRDPMAMLPFCGYHMADYFQHWLNIGQRSNNLPRIFHVNWFRKDAAGKFLWPGYGENSRILKWIFDRCNLPPTDSTLAAPSPIGYLPTPGSIDRAGLPVSDNDMKELLKFNPESWRAELPSLRAHYAQFGEKLPRPLADQLSALEQQLASS